MFLFECLFRYVCEIRCMIRFKVTVFKRTAKDFIMLCFLSGERIALIDTDYEE